MSRLTKEVTMSRWFAAFVGFLAEEAAHRILRKRRRK